MKIDTAVGVRGPRDVAAEAAAAEAAGYDGVWAGEAAHDPFVAIAMAACATTQVDVGTSIAVAFARNPMNLAVVGNDLQTAAGGRFHLGLGTQVKAHIERRYSMPWDRPASRMREMIAAVRAIWASWNDRTPLRFEGDFYCHTMMTPFFDPGPNESGPPAILLAAVGERMTEIAGESADGLIVHPLTSRPYLETVTLPAVLRGLERSGRARGGFQVKYPGLVATGRTEELLELAKAGTRQQIAFYASTPAYRPVLEFHGWAGLQTELAALARSDRRDRWEQMGHLIDDEMLATFAIVAEPGAVAHAVFARFGTLIDRFSFYQAYPVPDGDVLQLARDLKRAAA